MISKRLAGARDFFQNRNQILHVGDFLLVEQNQRVFQHGFHALGVGHEVGRQITLVELHSFDDFNRRAGAFGSLRW